jgi:hypothetical protein
VNLDKERCNAEKIEERISAKRVEIDALRALREENWRRLEELGIDRAEMARWSDIDKIMVTRALGPKEKDDGKSG